MVSRVEPDFIITIGPGLGLWWTLMFSLGFAQLHNLMECEAKALL